MLQPKLAMVFDMILTPCSLLTTPLSPQKAMAAQRSPTDLQSPFPFYLSPPEFYGSRYHNPRVSSPPKQTAIRSSS